MKKKPLVSIISPCYNGEKYVSNFLDSVLSQTYEYIELIVVDDGSTDQTKQIIQSYQEAFGVRGFRLLYLYQANAGQAAAINRGLRIFEGEYLMWMDSDDILLPENVEKKVAFLENHPECGFVMCQAEEVPFDNLDDRLRVMCRRFENEDNLFEDLLKERNVCYGPGVILVRRTAFFAAIPSGQIFESRHGQNWQLMLPLAHMFDCGYIEEVLCKIVSHSDSHSRVRRTYQQSKERQEGFQKLQVVTIQALVDMLEAEKKQWICKVSVKYQKNVMILAAQNKKWKDYRAAVRQLRKLGYDTRSDELLVMKQRLYSIPWVRGLYYLICLSKRKIDDDN